MASFLAASTAHASGLYFSWRGVRPLGRGGAFVAGADDLGSIWYNPAGIYDSGTQILGDVAWLNFTTEFQRRALIKQKDPNSGAVVATYEQTFPESEGTSPIIPIPTLAGSYKVHDDWVIALGMQTPYAAITSFPEEVDDKPAPQRYSLITLDGSLLTVLGAFVAWAPHEQFRIGAGFNLLLGSFVATSMLSTCVPDRFFCAPEQPEWDAKVQLDAGPFAAPSGNIGIQYLPHKQWRIGLSFQGPMAVRSPAKFRERMPSSPIFETAYQEGEDGTVSFDLPWVLRAGVEFRPIEDLRLELTGTVEGWAMHDGIEVTSDDVALRNVVGFPDPYKIPDITMVRGFQNAGSVRLGAEYSFKLLDYEWQARAGVGYESSAIPNEYLSALTLDMDKITMGMGMSMNVGAWRFDIVYAHVFGISQDVDPAEGRVPLINPLEANTTEEHYVNGGHYAARANVLGVGLRYQFGVSPEPETKPAGHPGDPQNPQSQPYWANPPNEETQPPPEGENKPWGN